MAIETLTHHLRANWGWVVLRGFAAILFGLLAFARPGMTLAVLTLFWGAYALVDGVSTLVAAFRVRPEGGPFWQLLVVGAAGVIAGVLTFFWPGMTAIALLTFIAVWAVVAGAFQVLAAIRVRKEIVGEWRLILAGLVSVLFGIVLLARPGLGALAVIWWIAGFAVAFGVLLVLLGFRLRSLPVAPAAA
jgi:uncharacterized membrane protein HdeD (DUF308 family)